MSSTSTLESGVRTRLGRIGIWSGELRFGDAAERQKAAAELDELGFGAIWIPGGVGGDILEVVELTLAATRRATIATGIINIWRHEPAEIGSWWHRLSDDHKSRVMLGVGVSHMPLIGEAYQKPLARMQSFLDGLDGEGVPSDHVCIAALAPKMLKLSGERTAGTHPYLVTPEHSAIAREAVGPNRLVAPEQHVLLETDPARARAMGLESLRPYMQLPNYVNSWRRLGFSEEDVTGSDRLIDGIIAWGGAEVIADRVKRHHDAGADHVCVQVVTGEAAMSGAPPTQAWRTLAEALL
jgi:probable F420-dependent oxidoreductase